VHLPDQLSGLIARGARLVNRVRKRSSSNFKFAFLFLREDQRAALTRVYEFCRVVDDIVDEREISPAGRAEAEAGLARWSAEIARIYAGERPETELGRALAADIEAFSLPRFAFDEIIAGCAMDLDIATYIDMPALELYCYRVASCVGILCIGVFGDQSALAHAYARHLGLALQYTNILRDIGEDAARRRVYLPLDLLARHGLDERDILACTYDERFLAMAETFAGYAELEYQRAWAKLDQFDDLRPLLPAEIMGRTYHELLAELETRRYDVFTHRAELRRRDKLKVAAVSLAITSLPPGLPGARTLRSVLS